jgi:hypothetical protein
MLLNRLAGLILALGGSTLLILIGYLLYTRVDAWSAILVDIGMPAALLATLFGGFVVGFGVWLAVFARPRRVRISRPRGGASIVQRQTFTPR